MSTGRPADLFPRRYAWLLLAVLLPVLPLALQRGFLVQHDGFASDLIHNQFPYRVFAGRALRAGRFPLWMPEVFSGVPYLAQIEAGPLYLPNLLLFGIFDPYTALNLSIVFTFLLGASGLYHLARCYGADRVSACLGGIVFALSGFNVSHVKHMNMHEAAAFLPWMMLCLEKSWVSRSTRWLIGLALATALQVSAGHPQIAYYSLLLLAARTVALAVSDARDATAAADGPSRAWRAVASKAQVIAFALALGLGVAAVQLITTYAFNRNSVRAGLDWQFASGFPYYVPDLLTFLSPGANGTTARMDYRGTIEWENYGYFGLVPLTLVLVSALLVRGKTVRFHAAAIVVSMLLVLGPATPLYRWFWEWFPGMRLFRFPTRFLLIVSLSAGVLSALASTWVGDRLRARRGGSMARAVLLGILLVSAVDLTWWQRMRLPIDDLRAWRRANPAVEAIHAQQSAGRGASMDDAPRVYSLLGPESWYGAWEESRGFQGGFEPYRRVSQLPFGNLSLIHDLDNAEGYTNMLDQRTASFWMWYNTPLLTKTFQPERYDRRVERITPAFGALLDAAAVRYVLTPVPVRNENFVLLHDGPVRVYENRSALPRAYLAYSWQPVGSIDAAAAWVFDGAHRGVPAIEAARPPGAVPGAASMGDVVVRSDRPDRIEFAIEPAADAYLVLTDSYDRGWTAEVDDRKVPILPANGYQRAVEVARNSRRVAFTYRPPGMAAGGTLSLLSLVALAAWAYAGRRRRVQDCR